AGPLPAPGPAEGRRVPARLLGLLRLPDRARRLRLRLRQRPVGLRRQVSGRRAAARGQGRSAAADPGA
ncbi:hypothetical protein RZS08_04870, partial [Arthrospira platensis SPKY1]|nr:hypothetical protein [Arthrospira platensis SPKY1]